MKARKINLAPYTVSVPSARSPVVLKLIQTPGIIEALQNANNWSEEEIHPLIMQQTTEQDYKVKDSIVNVLFELQMSSKEAWKSRDPLAEKIESSNNKVLLLLGGGGRGRRGRDEVQPQMADADQRD